MSFKEAVILLERNGFIQINCKGSHKKFAKGNLRITLADNKTYKKSLHPKALKEIKNCLNGK